MAPKKKPKNAFMLFSLSFKDAEQKKRNFLSVNEATNLAGNVWATMTPQQRAPWQEKAKADKIRMNYNFAEKLTSQGIPLSYIENERKEQEAKQRKMKKDICEMIQNSTIRNELETQSYYFIMVNYFIKTAEKSLYVPAEISLVEYSLKMGNIKKFHSFINPGDGIYGHAYEAQQHSGETHQLPLPPHSFGERDVSKLFTSVLDFIDPDGKGNYPPLFTLSECIPVVESAINYISGASEIDEELRIYPLQFLFYNLKLETCANGEHPKPNSIYVTDTILERDYFEYHSGLACSYHDKIDKGKYCTLSCVVRWGYTFSDYMAMDLDIEMIPGRHLPMGTDVKKLSKIVSSKITNNQTTESFESGARGYTKPKTEPCDYCYGDFDKNEDFPPLGQTRNKTKTTVKPKSGSDNFISCFENAWANRSAAVPRVPENDSFILDSSGSSVGPGRGYLMQQSSARMSNLWSGSAGRGRGISRYDLNSFQSGPSNC